MAGPRRSARPGRPPGRPDPRPDLGALRAAPARARRPADVWLGLDLGTTFFKGAVLDLQRGRLGPVERVAAPTPLRGRPSGHHELDPGAVLRTARRLLTRLRRHAGRPAGLVVGGQMHALVLTDAAGLPLGNVATWQDERARSPHPRETGSYLDVLRRRAGAEAEAAVGRELFTGRPVSVLFWLAETGALPAGAVPRSLPDFVLTRLAGAPVASGVTQAAATGALDLERRGWHRPMLDALGLGRLSWPEVAGATDTVAHVRLGGHPVPVLAPAGDQQAALLGAGLAEGELSLNVATGCQVSRLSARPVSGDYQLRPALDGGWLRTVVHIPAGRSLLALVRLLTELARAEGLTLRRPWRTIERAAAAVPSTDLRVDLAFFPSATGDRGAIANIREEILTAGHLFRAAYAAVVEGLARATERVAPERDLGGIVLSGGLVQASPLLRRLIGEAFPGPVRQAPAEDALTGLLRLARLARGR